MKEWMGKNNERLYLRPPNACGSPNRSNEFEGRPPVGVFKDGCVMSFVDELENMPDHQRPIVGISGWKPGLLGK